MTRHLISILSALLAVQLAITVAVYWPHDAEETGAGSALLAADSEDDIDQIDIADDDGNRVTLIHTDAGWQLANGLPAEPGKTARLLTALRATSGWPVARSIDARPRFEVAADRFQRRIELTQIDTTQTTVYLGTAPGLRKVHARRDGQDPIYSIDFNSYDAPAEVSGWLDRGLLAIADPVTISWENIRLKRNTDGWGAVDRDTPDPAAVQTLIGSLENLQVGGLAEPSASAQSAAALHIETDAKKLQLEFAQEGEQRFVRSSAYDFWFGLGRYDFDLITETLTRISAEVEQTPVEATAPLAATESAPED